MKKEKYITEKVGKLGITLEVKIPYYNDYGERKFHSKSFNTSDYSTNSEAMRAAVNYRNKYLFQLKEFGVTENKKVNVKDCYELTSQFFGFSKETQRKHDIRFNYISKYHYQPINKITAFQIQMSLQEISDKSQGVINSVFTLWKQIFHVAIANNYVFMDPTLKVQVPRSRQISVPKSVEMECTLEDVVTAIRNYGRCPFDSEIISYAIITMYYLGLRPSEAYAINKKDVDFDRRTVRINKAIGSTSDIQVTVKTTKNPNSVRILPLPDELIPYLKECMAIQPSEYLFTTESGQFITSRKYSNFIHNAMVKANINFRPYMLRHLFSTKLVTSNTDLRTVQELMGHKSMNMTLGYARSSDQLKREAVNRIS